MRIKQESDTSSLDADKAALIARLYKAVPNRDAGEVATQADVSGYYDDYSRGGIGY